MNFLKRLTYRTEVITVARWLGVRPILRKLYFWWARPKNGILPVELAGVKARFYVQTPEELRILESTGGAGGEGQVVAQVLEFLKPGDMVFDIGANVGLYTVLLAKTVGDAGRVFAFEPEARTCEHLQENLKLNEALNVKWYRKALGERTGQASLFTGTVIGGGSLVHSQGGGDAEQVVEIAQGDELVAAEKLPTPRAVKIDVEGYEHAVIQGLRHTLSEPGCEMICCEIHPSMLPAGVTPEAVLNLVDSLGFKQIQQFPRWDKTFHVVARKSAA
jgi:FkbM family methyltransferase